MKSEISVTESYTPQQIREDRPLRFFLSYAHLDGGLKDDLLHRLQVRLTNHKKLRFEPWTDGDILIGADWFHEIKRAMDKCDFAILLLSPEFLSRDFIRDNELPWLYANKPIIPVALRPLTKSLGIRGLEATQIFFHNKKTYSDHTTARAKDQFVDALFEALCKRLESTSTPKPTHFDHFRLSVSDVDLKTFAPTEGHETNLHKGLDPAPAIDSKLRKDAIQVLTEWLDDPNGQPYAVLLGETGLGKTTTCKVFANRLFERRETGKSAPLPIYFDLRHIGGRGKNLVLDEIIDLIFKESWKGGPNQQPLTSGDIYRQIAAEPTLVIWDGLDEVLVHLDDNEGQRFTRQLYRILPPPARTGGRRPGRMLVTCRTHYFRTLRDQQTHLRGEDRDNIREQDYRAPFLLLPFTAVQIKTYLKATLPDRDPDGVLQVIAGVHNLTEMAERPYTLSLIVREFETIERWKAEGRKVTAVTLYRHLVKSWLERDAGKHQIQPDHKQLIMEHLAAALWRSGQRYWNVADLEERLLDFLDANPKVRRHYPNMGPAQLKEDLRTATFLVRDGDDQFRFAHTSLQEFFLAGYLRRALIDNQPDRWAITAVSNETLDFLGQWLLEDKDDLRAAAMSTLGRIRDGYVPLASENAFRYCLKGYPSPSMEGFQLPGADLVELEFEGARIDRINLQGARLWNTCWRDCSLSGADMSGADATGAEFLNCRMERSDWRGCTLEATTFRDCDLHSATFAGVRGEKSRWLQCQITDARLPADALLALNRPPQPSPLAKQCELWVASGHRSYVQACAWSPDGDRIVSASADNTLRIWDPKSGQSLRTLSGHEESVWGCSWSPEGRRIASASFDKTLRIWDAESGQSLRTLSGHEDRVVDCAWSPDGRRIVSASNDNTLRIWDAESGQSLRMLIGHGNSVIGCAWSPDGPRIVSSSNDKTLRIWDAESGQSLCTLIGHTAGINFCAWSPDGARIASASDDQTLQIWDAQSGVSVHKLSDHHGAVVSCAWSPDGRRILSVSEHDSLRIWDAGSGENLWTRSEEVDGSPLNCAWCPDGRRIALTYGDGTLRISDGRSAQNLHTLGVPEVSTFGCAWSPDGRRIVSASDDNTLRIWGTESGRSLRTLRGHESAVYSCAWSPDGRRIVSASYDKTLRIWDAESGHSLRTLSGHKDYVLGCTWSPDGRRIVSASVDNTLQIWNADSGKSLPTLRGHGSTICGCGWSPDGRRIVSASYDATLRIWDAESGQSQRRLGGHRLAVLSCAWSPDGQRIVSASADETLRVWGAKSGRSLRILREHSGTVRGCAWSPNGQHIVSASEDNTLRIWDANSGKSLRTLIGHASGVRSCAWSPDGRLIASTSYDGTLRLWRPETGQELDRRIYLRYTPDGPTWATIDHRNNRILACHPDAWRILGWLTTNPGTMPTILPAETFGPLPYSNT